MTGDLGAAGDRCGGGNVPFLPNAPLPALQLELVVRNDFEQSGRREDGFGNVRRLVTAEPEARLVTPAEFDGWLRVLQPAHDLMWDTWRWADEATHSRPMVAVVFMGASIVNGYGPDPTWPGTGDADDRSLTPSSGRFSSVVSELTAICQAQQRAAARSGDVAAVRSTAAPCNLVPIC